MPCAVEVLQAPLADKLPSDLENLHTTFRRLQESLDQAHAYVQDVVVRCPTVWPAGVAPDTCNCKRML